MVWYNINIISVDEMEVQSCKTYNVAAKVLATTAAFFQGYTFTPNEEETDKTTIFLVSSYFTSVPSSLASGV